MLNTPNRWNQSRSKLYVNKFPLFVIAVTCACAGGCPAAELAAGTSIEVRLSTATGSRISRPGEGIKATVIAPVFEQGQLAIPQGATISGMVERVTRLGWGLRNRTATIDYKFDSLRLPSGETIPIEARVQEVETAKERVSRFGSVSGIYPTANLSSGVSFVTSALFVAPHFVVSVMAVKLLIARSPDPEIYFPAGTEMVVRSASPIRVAKASFGLVQPRPLSAPDIASAEHLLESLPEQHTHRGPNHPSDLINILLLGTREQVEEAFHAAGWSGANGHSVRSLYRMYHASVQRMSYAMAPMTELTLNGRVPDSSYQKSLDTFSKRHHIRVWQQKDSEAWVGAATEDIGYKVRQMHLTHATAREIDNERSKVVNDLALTGCLGSGGLIARDPRKVVDEEGTSLSRDGKIAVLRLSDCRGDGTNTTDAGMFGKLPSRRSVRILSAIGIDFLRCNPVSLVYGTMKAIFGQSDLQRNETMARSNQRREETSEANNARQQWKRPSILDLPEATVTADGMPYLPNRPPSP